MSHRNFRIVKNTVLLKSRIGAMNLE